MADLAETIPSVDFSPFMVDEGCMVGASPDAAQRNVAAEIDAIMQAHGFLYLENFGVEETEISASFDAAKDLFSLADEKKRTQLARWTVGTKIGYAPPNAEAINPVRAPDMRESYMIRSRHRYAHDYSGMPLTFEPAFHTLWDKVADAGRRFQVACALALGLPTDELDFFSSKSTKMDACSMRPNHYAPCCFEETITDGLDQKGAIRIGEHTDFGLLTFLFSGN